MFAALFRACGAALVLLALAPCAAATWRDVLDGCTAILASVPPAT